MRLSSPTLMRWVILISAILVWVNIYAFINRTEIISTPLLIEDLSSHLSIAESVTTVAVTVSGGLRDVSKISASNLQFKLDTSSVTGVGTYTLNVQPKLAPDHIKILSFEPRQLTLTVELTATKSVNVVALSKGNPNDKYSIKSLNAIPAQVIVFGAPTLLDKISEARAYVDVNGQKTSFTVPTPVAVFDGKNQAITSLRIEPTNIKVNVEIVEGASVRNLGLKPSFTGELPGGFWIQEVKFEPTIVQVKGPQKTLDALVSLSSTPISLNNRRASFNEQVAVNLPDGIEMVGENVVLAHVVLGSSEGTRQFDIMPQYINVTEGFGVTTINPASVQVVVSGDPKTINQLKRTDIKLNLDLSGTLSGSNTVTITPAMFSLPPNFQVVSFTPDKVEVVLTRL